MGSLKESLGALYEHYLAMDRAIKAREARRLEHMFPGADRIVRFRSAGRNYLFARMPDGTVLAALNGRAMKKPPKAIIRFARQRMAERDVAEVHGL